MSTPENITQLEEKEIFVFGSNMFGEHIGGAARTAREQFGAESGIGEGLSGKTYAFPTLYSDMTKRNRVGLETSRNKLYATARALPEKTFLLTKVGCGIAGFEEEYMRELFKDSPQNIIKLLNW